MPNDGGFKFKNYGGENLDTVQVKPKPKKELSPEEFINLAQENNQRIAKLRQQYNEGEGISSQPEQMVSGIEAAKELYHSPIGQTIAAPIKTASKVLPDILKRNIGEAARNVTQFPLDLLNLGLAPIALPSQAIGEKLAQTNIGKSIDKSDLAQRINNLINNPYQNIYRGVSAITGNPNAMPSKTEENIGNLGIMYLLGKAQEKLAPQEFKPLTKLSEERTKELQNENKNQTTGPVSPIEGKSALKQTEGQTEIRTPQRRSESIQQEKTPQADKGLKIVSTAVNDNGKILTGKDKFESHNNIGEQNGIGKPAENTRGFLVEDSNGIQRFVDRKEGAKIAQESGQIEKPVEELHSEDLQKAGFEEVKPVESRIRKPAKAASDINKTLAAKGFDELPEDELSSFNTITKEDQINKSASLLENDYNAAKNMAISGKGVPAGVNKQVLFNAVKNKAIQENDAETLRSLASSPIARERSKAAQTLGASGFNNNPFDPVKAIEDVKKVREDNYVKKNPGRDIDKMRDQIKEPIKKEMAKNNLQFKDWQSFIKSIECA